MASIAIAGNLNKEMKADPAYRYKMEPILGKVEGKGNGIKTCIVNCKEIASEGDKLPADITDTCCGKPAGARKHATKA